MSVTEMQGKVFGRLTVERRGANSPNGTAKWQCRCECGAVRVVDGSALRNGHTRSCGCLSADLSARRSTKHGLLFGGKTPPLYKVWAAIKGRCCNKNDAAYAYYGGRGIFVCERWRNDFAAFLADMGARPPGGTVDRINNDGPYSPENCRWATRKEQANNTRGNVKYQGASISEWAERLGTGPSTISSRVAKWGWERATLTPIGRYTRHGC